MPLRAGCDRHKGSCVLQENKNRKYKWIEGEKGPLLNRPERKRLSFFKAGSW
jgi:hypothetical protein